MIAGTAVFAVAASGSLLAVMGFDPALTSPLNFAILVYMAVYTRREITTLRRESVEAATELARTAKGSEDRATNAAAEITRLSGQMTALAAKMGAMQARDEAVMVEILVVLRAVKDKLALLRVEGEIQEPGREPPR